MPEPRQDARVRVDGSVRKYESEEVQRRGTNPQKIEGSKVGVLIAFRTVPKGDTGVTPDVRVRVDRGERDEGWEGGRGRKLGEWIELKVSS